MKTQYIVPESHTHGYHHFFRQWASIPLSDGRHLLSVEFHNEALQYEFEQMESVEPLPDPRTHISISESHFNALQDLGIKRGHTTKDVLNEVRKAYRAM